jgi:hypothetical protein
MLPQKAWTAERGTGHGERKDMEIKKQRKQRRQEIGDEIKLVRTQNFSVGGGLTLRLIYV